MLRYDYLRYLAILIPYELCGNLYSITNTYGNQNVNCVALNSAYNPELAHEIQYNDIIRDVSFDECDAVFYKICSSEILNRGTDVEKFVKPVSHKVHSEDYYF